MYYDAYYSDPHFSHKNIIHYCGRPYNDIEQMNEMMISNYNKIVRKSDNVLFTGDIFFSSSQEYRISIIKRLNGTKHLLRGNHDKKITDTQFYEMGFDTIYSSHFLGTVGNHAVRFSHFPHYSLDGDQRYADVRPPKEPGVTLVHGHTHEHDRITKYGTIHVGVDAWDMAPAPHDEVVKLIEELKQKR